MHPLEIEGLRDIVSAAGADKNAVDTVIDLRLNYHQNKRIVKEWLKASGKAVDLRSEMVTEKALDGKMAVAIRTEIEAKEAIKYKAVKGKKEAVQAAISEKKVDIMKEIEAYNPYCSGVTYSTLFAAMNAKQGSQKTHAINKGKQGIGKSRGTSELVSKLDLADAVIIKGYMTPKKLFETLKKNYANMIILDESELIMNDPQALFILRSALYGGEVAWLSSRGESLDQFKFEGTIIANLNHFGVTEAEAAPLFDRTLFNDTQLDNTQIIEKMRSVDTYKMQPELWSLIKDQVTIARNEGLLTLEPPEEEFVMAFIESVVRGGSVFNKSLSTRARARSMLVAKCLKTLYGEFKEPEKELFRTLAKPYISNDDADEITVKLLRSNPKLTRLELAELISENKQISVRQATRLIKAGIDRGILIAINRTKIAINDGTAKPEVDTDDSEKK